MQEDHVSMGWGAARKLRASLANLARILAVELVCAARGLDLRAPLEPAAPAPRRRWPRVREPACPGPGPTAGSRRSSSGGASELVASRRELLRRALERGASGSWR